MWEPEGGDEEALPSVGSSPCWSSGVCCCPLSVVPPQKKQTKKTPQSLLNRLPVEVSRGKLSFLESLLTEGQMPKKMVKLHKTSQLSRIANEASPRGLNKQTQISLTFIV